MTRDEWTKLLQECTQQAGTYRPYFDPVIEALAVIMEQRDDALDKFYATGGSTIISHTNKAKQTNYVKNPALVMFNDLSATALHYWRDLGLTPAGLKRIDEKAMEQRRKTALDDMAELLKDAEA